MKVKVLYDNFTDPKLKSKIEKSLQMETFPLKYKNYIKQQVLLTKGKEYEVYAIANIEGCTSFQVIDDSEDWPCFYPYFMFEIIDNIMPIDWVCNYFFEKNNLMPVLLIGPEFVVKDADSYNNMVENDPPQIDLFWKRVERLRKNQLLL